LKILFVGNSPTYTNDLPVLIAETGLKDGITITYTSLLFPNYSLEDHWNEGKVRKELQKGIYDIVINPARAFRITGITGLTVD
jgi:hypothetical protein